MSPSILSDLLKNISFGKPKDKQPDPSDSTPLSPSTTVANESQKSESSAHPFRLGNFSVDEYKPLKVVVIGAGFSGIVAGIRYVLIVLPSRPRSSLSPPLDSAKRSQISISPFTTKTLVSVGHGIPTNIRASQAQTFRFRLQELTLNPLINSGLACDIPSHSVSPFNPLFPVPTPHPCPCPWTTASHPPRTNI